MKSEQYLSQEDGPGHRSKGSWGCSHADVGHGYLSVFTGRKMTVASLYVDETITYKCSGQFSDAKTDRQNV